MDFSPLISPKTETWWQFALYALVLTGLLYVLLRKVLSMGLSQSLHPKIARQLGSMTTWVVMAFAISLILFIDFVSNFGTPTMWLNHYLTPLIFIMVYLILFLITRMRLRRQS